MIGSLSLKQACHATHSIFSPTVLIKSVLSLDRGLSEYICVFQGSNLLFVKEYSHVYYVVISLVNSLKIADIDPL